MYDKIQSLLWIGTTLSGHKWVAKSAYKNLTKNMVWNNGLF